MVASSVGRVVVALPAGLREVGASVGTTDKEPMVKAMVAESTVAVRAAS